MVALRRRVPVAGGKVCRGEIVGEGILPRGLQTSERPVFTGYNLSTCSSFVCRGSRLDGAHTARAPPLPPSPTARYCTQHSPPTTRIMCSQDVFLMISWTSNATRSREDTISLLVFVVHDYVCRHYSSLPPSQITYALSNRGILQFK